MTTTTGSDLTADTTPAGFVKVTVVSPTGQEEIDVPESIAADDDLLRSMLANAGVSAAANASIERLEDGVKLTKQADRNG